MKTKDEVINAIDKYMRSKGDAIGKCYADKGHEWDGNNFYNENDKENLYDYDIETLMDAISILLSMSIVSDGACCIYCQIHRWGCEECRYALEHGFCDKDDSSYIIIKRTIGGLICDVVYHSSDAFNNNFSVASSYVGNNIKELEEMVADLKEETEVAKRWW